jgi:hypothetical protein
MIRLIEPKHYEERIREFNLLFQAKFRARGLVADGRCEIVEFYINVAGFWRPYHGEPFVGASEIYRKEFSHASQNGIA